MTTIAVLWQMMYRIKDWFIHLLILSTVNEHDIQKKQLYSDQTCSRWKNVNKMIHFTVIAELNVAQKKIQQGDLSFFMLILFQYMSAL